MTEGPQEPSFADVLNGFSGSGPRRRERRGFFRRRQNEETPEDRQGDGRPDEGVPDESTGGHARSVPGTGYDLAVDTKTDPAGLDLYGGDGRVHREVDDLDPDPSADHGDAAAIVRPYAWTGGRTRPSYDLEIETLVSTTPAGRDPAAVRQYEHQAVAELCREPRSVAEVAALLKLPLGVARVLLGDMATQGTVLVHQTATAAGDVPDMALMERVLSGLRRL